MVPPSFSVGGNVYDLYPKERVKYEFVVYGN
jgi:hypothetical protein